MPNLLEQVMRPAVQQGAVTQEEARQLIAAFDTDRFVAKLLAAQPLIMAESIPVSMAFAQELAEQMVKEKSAEE